MKYCQAQVQVLSPKSMSKVQRESGNELGLGLVSSSRQPATTPPHTAPAVLQLLCQLFTLAVITAWKTNQIQAVITNQLLLIGCGCCVTAGAMPTNKFSQLKCQSSIRKRPFLSLAFWNLLWPSIILYDLLWPFIAFCELLCLSMIKYQAVV